MAGNLQSYGPVTLLGSGGRVKALQHAYARVLAPHPIMGNALLHDSFSLTERDAEERNEPVPSAT